MNRRGFLFRVVLAPLAAVLGLKVLATPPVSDAPVKPNISDAWRRTGLFNNADLDKTESILQSVKRKYLAEQKAKLSAKDLSYITRRSYLPKLQEQVYGTEAIEKWKKEG